MSQIPSKTTSQKFLQSYPPSICHQSWNWSRNKKVENALFALQNFLNTIHPQMNTTKEVIDTLPNYHQEEFMICWKKFPIFHNPSIHQNPFFSPFEPSSEVITHHIECTRVKCTQPSNTPTCTLQLSCNITKETHLSSCAQTMFSFYDASIFIRLCSTKIPFMLLCHIKISQTLYLSRANHMLHHKSSKYYTEITFKPL